MSVLAIILAGLAAAAPATSNTYINGRITRNLSGTIDIYEPWLHVNEWVSPWAGGATVSGSPVSGQVSRGGGYLHFFGPGLDADANEFGGSYRVNATIRRPGQPPVPMSFMLQATGPINDPRFPPTFSVWESGANLRLNPSAGGRDYDLSGWVDPQRFGAEGVALVGIIAAMALDKRAAAPAPDGKPNSPAERVFRVLPFPALPIRP